MCEGQEQFLGGMTWVSFTNPEGVLLEWSRESYTEYRVSPTLTLNHFQPNSRLEKKHWFTQVRGPEQELGLAASTAAPRGAVIRSLCPPPGLCTSWHHCLEIATSLPGFILLIFQISAQYHFFPEGLSDPLPAAALPSLSALNVCSVVTSIHTFLAQHLPHIHHICIYVCCTRLVFCLLFSLEHELHEARDPVSTGRAAHSPQNPAGHPTHDGSLLQNICWVDGDHFST